MAVTATWTISRAYDNVSGAKRETGGTLTFSGACDASETTFTHNNLGLKQVEFLSIEGGTGDNTLIQPVIGVELTSTGGKLRFYGTGASAANPLTECTAGTSANFGTFQWRARGY